jgi:hypothetical protein
MTCAMFLHATEYPHAPRLALRGGKCVDLDSFMKGTSVAHHVLRSAQSFVLIAFLAATALVRAGSTPARTVQPAPGAGAVAGPGAAPGARFPGTRSPRSAGDRGRVELLTHPRTHHLVGGVGIDAVCDAPNRGLAGRHVAAGHWVDTASGQCQQLLRQVRCTVPDLPKGAGTGQHREHRDRQHRADLMPTPRGLRGSATWLSIATSLRTPATPASHSSPDTAVSDDNDSRTCDTGNWWPPQPLMILVW